MQSYIFGPVQLPQSGVLPDPGIPLHRYTIHDTGYTEVDNIGLEEIKKMPNLKHLNLDGVNISGKAFVELCKTYPDRYGGLWPLRTLSIEEMSPSDKESLGKVSSERFTLQDLEEMAKYLPELTYIGISKIAFMQETVRICEVLISARYLP